MVQELREREPPHKHLREHKNDVGMEGWAGGVGMKETQRAKKTSAPLLSAKGVRMTRGLSQHQSMLCPFEPFHYS